ncbi:MAG: hypothetical protein NT029_16000 [Armatimonadetes bacterium]|jgi:hypothetical protein|nr:hypothetical protein [Armatimonadota bacterium]
MGLEFQRSKQAVSGRTILVTSWYDEHTLSYKASAPEYARLLNRDGLPGDGCLSRSAAVGLVVNALDEYFTAD